MKTKTRQKITIWAKLNTLYQVSSGYKAKKVAYFNLQTGALQAVGRLK